MYRGFYDRTRRQVRDLSSGPFRVLLDLEVRRVRCRRCGAVKRERLAFLADNPLYTQRFAYYVGRRCRSATIKDIAEELHLDWDAVKELDKQYMRAQRKRAGTPGPKAIGIDEISIRKGHTYRIVVSDLIRHRPIWFGGQDRSEASMDEFYQFLGEKKAKKIRLAVMDMWKAFRTSTRHHAPQAAILFDKVHVLRRLGKALDTIRPRIASRNFVTGCLTSNVTETVTLEVLDPNLWLIFSPAQSDAGGGRSSFDLTMAVTLLVSS